MMPVKGLFYAFIFSMVFQACLAVSTEAAETTVDTSLLEQLQQLIEQQQEQLRSQSETIEALTTRVDQLEQKPTGPETSVTATPKSVIDTAEPSSTAQLPGKLVTSGSKKVSLAISGHINRAINVADDGNETQAYFVDNDVSNSRIRFVGTGQVTENTSVGPRMEIAFSPNNSFDVSQDNEVADDFIDVRKVEAFVRNDRFGQLLFGKGSAAADDTAEYDLSLVAGPIMYSGIADIVGGLQFTDDDGELSGLSVGDAFFNFDGNRQDRVRYDSPVYGPGVQLSVSVGANQTTDAALTWGGDYGDWSGVDIGDITTLGAVSIRDPNEDDVDMRLAGSFSALHNPTGLSLTVSAGTDKKDNAADPYNLYGKVGWDTSFFPIGPTGFGADLTYTKNFSGDGDEGIGVGLSAIQLIEDWGIELYSQYRIFDLDRESGDNVDEIVVGTVGTRIKF